MSLRVAFSRWPYYEPKWPIPWTVTTVWKWTIVLVLLADAALLVWAVWNLVSPADELRSFFNAVSD